MANLKFVDQHNMIAYLEKSDDNTEFYRIVDFLSLCPITYAITVSPTMYASYSEQFWNTASSKIINYVKQIHAIVDGKAVVISESSVRSDILFDDEDGISCLTNDEIFENLAFMGCEPLSTKLTFQKVLGAKKPWAVLLLKLGLRECLNNLMIHLSQERLNSSRRAVVIHSSDEEEPSVDIEDSPKHRRIIEAIDEDENVNLYNKRQGKGIMQETELPKKIKKKEMVQLSLNEELAQKLYAEELVRMQQDKNMKDSRRVQAELFQRNEQESSKKQKLDQQTEEEEEEVKAQGDNDQEVEHMKLYMRIVPDEEISIDAIPLATKPPIIVEYKIIKKGKINTYHITRADGSTKRYTSMINLLENIDREDLETLWKLVKDKHRNTRPEEGYERVLWGDLQVMFEPYIESKWGFDDRKEHSPDTDLFCESTAAGSRAKLYPNGKASPDASLRSQKITQIVPVASHRDHHRPTHQANFLVEKPDDASPHTPVIETPQETWTLFTDGSSCVDGSGVGLILTRPDGMEFTYALRFQFPLLTTKQILKKKSIQEDEVTMVVEEEGPTWMTLIIEYLKEGTLRGDRKAASKLRIKARQYEWLEGVLYRWSFLKPWLSETPAANGLVERANRSLGKGIKAGLGEGNNNWIEELPHVLWAHCTMTKSSHGDTPFSLTYGTEAVIPAEIRMPTYRTAVVDAVHNNEELRLNLDLLEERPGDFVYRSNEESHVMDEGKLGPKWEGPYEVIEELRDGAYRLRSMDGAVLPRKWRMLSLSNDMENSHYN
nr:reverse transcriptase domain-containing protein [Tanacetum cinerariifolium]